MTDPETKPQADPRDALRALSDLLKSRSAAAQREMKTNREYWGPEPSDEAFTRGIDGAVGDEHLASSFTPGFAATLADLLDVLVEATPGADLCNHSFAIYNTARELAERYPGLATGDEWVLAVRPRPEEPKAFGAKIKGWVNRPSEDCEWVRLGNGYWAGQHGGQREYSDITVTEILS
jgi:hypothetical protein